MLHHAATREAVSCESCDEEQTLTITSPVLYHLTQHCCRQNNTNKLTACRTTVHGQALWMDMWFIWYTDNEKPVQ